MNRKLVLMLTFTLLFGILYGAFNVQPVKASGTIYIRDDGSVDPYDAPISTIDNVTYTLTGNITGDYGSALLLERDNIVVDGSAHTIEGVPEYGIGIWLNGRNNVTIRNMNVLNFRIGIYLDSCSLISINANTIEKCYLYGIWLHSSSLISIYGNSLARNWNGIWLDSSSGNRISANSETNNGMGIFLICSSNNSISGNDITNGGDIYDGGGGIHLSLSSNNSIAGNNIADNGYVGIRISSSTNNSISENTIASNSHGIIFSQYRGDFTLGPLSSFNSIWHDNFINNTVQVGGDDIYLSGCVEFWDNGCEGNYWSNYTGVDSEHDGIGDSWYEIDSSNIDHYPLMGRFSDFNVTLKHHVQTVCNSSISNFQYNGTAVSFNVSGENGTVGFCRICIPTALMVDNCTVFVDGAKVNSTLLPCSDTNNSYLYFDYELSTKDTLKDRADINKDGIVDLRDAAIMSYAWGSRPGDPNWKPEADLNNDGVIDNVDVDLLKSVFYERTDIAEYQIMIIPEFPSILALSLFIIATLLAVILYKRKRAKLSRATSVS